MTSGKSRFGMPLDLGDLVAAALAEDVGEGDVTTRWTVPEDATGRAEIIARQDGVVCGLEAVKATFERVDPGLDWEARVADADAVRSGAVVASIEGRLASILVAERSALNFLGRLSGIATQAAAFAEALAGTGCRVLDTRKTTPGWRALEKYATRCGGAVNHRAGLYDMVLIKENHIRAAGGIGAALGAVAEPAAAAGLEVEVEVTCLDELRRALEGLPDRVLLDNMSVEELEAAVQLVRESSVRAPLLEASGNVTLATVGAVGRTGVDFVSVGALTHSATVMDFSLQVR